MKMRLILPCVLGLAASTVTAGAEPGSTQQCGTASWYELTSMTANGETANPEGLTAAHKSLAFGTKVKVENLENGRTIILRINDRGPYIKGRIIDVTRSAANRLGFQNQGTVRVRVTMAEPNGKALPRGCS